jgi:ABC-type multidrug transport system permease subunit
MLRTVAGIIVGIVVFVAVLMVMEYVAHQLFRTSPAGPLPTGMYAFVALAYFVSAFVGGLMAVKISRQRWTGWLIAMLVAAGAVYSLTTLAQPMWMHVASVVAPLLGGLLATRVGSRGTRLADARV